MACQPPAAVANVIAAMAYILLVVAAMAGSTLSYMMGRWEGRDDAIRKMANAIMVGMGEHCPKCGAYRCHDCGLIVISRHDHAFRCGQAGK